ncbi:MAG: hypothetical protein R3C46_10440 [Hyphomonadaceae bacterium]
MLGAGAAVLAESAQAQEIGLLARIDLSHAYYGSLPVPVRLGLLERAQSAELALRAVEGGYLLMARGGRPERVLLKMEVTDPYFANVTTIAGQGLTPDEPLALRAGPEDGPARISTELLELTPEEASSLRQGSPGLFQAIEITLPEEGVLGTSVRFDTRATIWRYFLFVREGQEVLSVDDPAGNIAFINKGASEIANRAAVVFESAQPAPLAARYDRPNFVVSVRSGDGINSVTLPFAGSQQLRAREDGSITSDMYVYL